MRQNLFKAAILNQPLGLTLLNAYIIITIIHNTVKQRHEYKSSTIHINKIN